MKKYIALFSVFLFALFLFLEQSQALKITLKRVIFEGPKRAEVLTVINNTDKETTFRLGWRQLHMTPDKGLVDVRNDAEAAKIGAAPVGDMVRFAPRRFTLQPNSSQQVRMVLRAPGDLADGEYRSHFWVRPEADVKDLSVNDEPVRGDALSINIAMLAGVTMPVIIRKGALDATPTIENAQASATGGFINVKYTLGRLGNRSIYGDIDYVCNPGESNEYLLKTIRGVSVYTEIDYRSFDVRLEKQLGANACNTMSITYTETNGVDGDRTSNVAQQVVRVN